MLTMKDIVREGNPILRERATNVELPPQQEDIQIAKEMLEFLKTVKIPSWHKNTTFGLE